MVSVFLQTRGLGFLWQKMRGYVIKETILNIHVEAFLIIGSQCKKLVEK
jgi:hypothetical protein